MVCFVLFCFVLTSGQNLALLIKIDRLLVVLVKIENKSTEVSELDSYRCKVLSIPHLADRKCQPLGIAELLKSEALKSHFG